MQFSSRNQLADSPLKSLGVSLELPAGDGWFPDMLVYHDATGLKDKSGQPLDLTIFYTFGAFQDGRSTFYTPGSGYYASFYGAYAIHGKTLPDPTPELLEKVAAYDYERLILSALGLSRTTGSFKVSRLSQTKVESYLGYSDWSRYNLKADVPGPAHERAGWLRHYWQFGTPPPLNGEPFESAALYGRVYVKVFPEKNMTLMLYLLCESEMILENTDRTLMSQGEWRMEEGMAK
jgi:hypothetical protein